MNENKIYLVLGLVSLSIGSFFAGGLFIYYYLEGDSINSKENIKLEELYVNLNDSKIIYASKRGKKYYFIWCQSSIIDENKIYFESEKRAQEAGYTKAKNC